MAYVYKKVICNFCCICGEFFDDNYYHFQDDNSPYSFLGCVNCQLAGPISSNLKFDEVFDNVYNALKKYKLNLDQCNDLIDKMYNLDKITINRILFFKSWLGMNLEQNQGGKRQYSVIDS